MAKEKRMFIVSLVFVTLSVVLIGLLGSRLDGIELLPDAGAAWYYWKLPVRDAVVMWIVWAMYGVHQISVWVLIYRLQHCDHNKRWHYNLWLMVINGIFILLHILQTHIWYDGLAQDVPVMSSQGSVIVMLVLILIIENKRRGLFFGKSVKGFKNITMFIRKYHGYFIAWALVYTFWYHPTISTAGHLFGFFYMFLLMIQMAFVKTKFHNNQYFKFALEVLVLAHGTAVAVLQGNNMWPMFAFGFGFMAVVTQVYGIGLPVWVRRSIQGLYIIGVIIVFGGFTGHREISDIHQITWIPIIEYLLVFVFLLIGEGVFKLTGKGKIKTP